jgi:hypothetical protein
MELFQDIFHKPLILICFNPDNYIDKNNKKISSCWKNNNKGICEIDDIKLWNLRLDILGIYISEIIQNINDYNKTIEIIYLFYDEK